MEKLIAQQILNELQFIQDMRRANDLPPDKTLDERIRYYEIKQRG